MEDFYNVQLTKQFAFSSVYTDDSLIIHIFVIFRV